MKRKGQIETIVAIVVIVLIVIIVLVVIAAFFSFSSVKMGEEVRTSGGVVEEVEEFESSPLKIIEGYQGEEG